MRGTRWLLCAALACAAPAQALGPADADVLYLPTPPAVVEAMLDLAGLRPDDLLVDLGAGDGRIPIAAARRGARAIGVELDARKVAEAKRNVEAAGVSARVEIRQGDARHADLGGTTVVTLFLLPELNRALRPKLQGLAPGTRIVSHRFGIGDWAPDRKVNAHGHPLFLWVVPARRAGGG
ncbi:MAG TPA: methyltransferase domain-containing protein [Burkholderiales bacterium]